MTNHYRSIGARQDIRSISLDRTNRYHMATYNYSYLIDFSMDPVEFGFWCDDSRFQREFKELGAFNKYFERLIDNRDAYTFPNVWDGYYRITLVQFETSDDPDQLKKKLNKLSLPNDVNTTVSGALFRSVKLDVNNTRSYRLPNDFCKEPIALYMSASQELQFESILRKLKGQIDYTRWKSTSREDLHMNIRLYRDTPRIDNVMTWNWERACELGIPEKVSQYPIEIFHSRLEIILNRSDCKGLYKKGRGSQWWSGVTELNRQCSGCKAPVGNQQEWTGVCCACNEYERIKPVWSLLFSGTVNIILR